MKKKLLALLLTASMLTLGVVGCGSTQTTSDNSDQTTESEATVSDGSTETEETTEDTSTDLSGTISLAGSTSMEKLCEALSESFMEANPGVTVTTEYTGSGTGLESLA